jgi:thymidylate synthase
VRKGEETDYLDMVLIQRSGDMLTASGPGGINEIQYAALLTMIAVHTGYTPGVFSHLVANEQIYDRHIDAAHEMLKRHHEKLKEESDETLVKNQWDDRPILLLNTDKTNFYDFTIDDWVILNYNPIKPQLKLELGI